MCHFYWIYTVLLVARGCFCRQPFCEWISFTLKTILRFQMEWLTKCTQTYTPLRAKTRKQMRTQMTHSSKMRRIFFARNKGFLKIWIAWEKKICKYFFFTCSTQIEYITIYYVDCTKIAFTHCGTWNELLLFFLLEKLNKMLRRVL